MPPDTLDCLENGARTPRHTLVWLHGLGADGHDLSTFAGLLLPEMSGVLRQVFPHAPYRHIALWGGETRAWYGFDSLEFGTSEHAADIDESVALIREVLERERRMLPPDGRLILGGFSQGGVIALAAGLAGDIRIDGIVALSTYLWGEVPDKHHALPVFMAHGTDDPVIPLALARSSVGRLRQAGIDVDWSEYPMQHQICDTEMVDLARWLRARLVAPPEPSTGG
ncbi:hypothetical protein BJI67_00120 [Acidihalobacter aeolianus]|uniref:Phospholipase/carboxylesterase/thioesterase domain-containing protein n=1 Tax=Acidihalobacter aeolianus TaxID=2792603 RepID=A0A1D8K3Z4_9GAMM|nr:alpha/beta fold hydrolase [Acidihalobacter aeolianus]AOV15677.1 hypothetical protein BJI67_00120 [Acidihalobacter aeolianus]